MNIMCVSVCKRYFYERPEADRLTRQLAAMSAQCTGYGPSLNAPA